MTTEPKRIEWGREPLWLPILKSLAVALIVGIPVLLLAKAMFPWYGAYSGVEAATRGFNYAMAFLSLLFFVGLPPGSTWLTWWRQRIITQGDLDTFIFVSNGGLRVRQEKLRFDQRRYEKDGPSWPFDLIYTQIKVDDVGAVGAEADFRIWWLSPSVADRLLQHKMLTKGEVKNTKPKESDFPTEPDAWAVAVIERLFVLYTAKLSDPEEETAPAELIKKYLKNIRVVVENRKSLNFRKAIQDSLQKQVIQDEFQL